MEVWKKVPFHLFEYEVSTFGRVRNLKTGRMMKATPNRDGYLYLDLCSQGLILRLQVHRIVLLTFVGEPQSGYECRHLDGKPSNNRLENLLWDSRSNNQKDKLKHGTVNRGEILSKKLTAKIISKIRSDGRPLRQIAEEFGVSVSNIKAIRYRRSWKHV